MPCFAMQTRGTEGVSAAQTRWWGMAETTQDTEWCIVSYEVKRVDNCVVVFHLCVQHRTLRVYPSHPLSHWRTQPMGWCWPHLGSILWGTAVWVPPSNYTRQYTVVVKCSSLFSIQSSWRPILTIIPAFLKIRPRKEDKKGCLQHLCQLSTGLRPLEG